MEDEIIIDEAGGFNKISITKGTDTIILTNATGEYIHENVIENEFSKIDGVDRIKTLIIEPDSQAANINFVATLKNLENLFVHGRNLKSLSGVSNLHKCKYIEIDTGKNKARNIEQLINTRVKKLSIHWANKDDIDVIGHCLFIKHLEIKGCPEISLKKLSATPIEEISFVNAKFEEIGDFGDIETLYDVAFFHCRKLMNIAGNNSRVTRLIIDTCNIVDFKNINSFVKLEYLNIVNMKNEIPLSYFIGLKNIKNLSLQSCKVILDVLELERNLPKLEELFISKLKNTDMVNLSTINKNIIVSNERCDYKNGAQIEAGY